MHVTGTATDMNTASDMRASCVRADGGLPGRAGGAGSCWKVPTGEDSFQNSLLCPASSPGKPFDPTFFLSCAGSNIISTLVFGERFEYNDKNFLLLLDLINSNWKLMSSTWGQVNPGIQGRLRVPPSQASPSKRCNGEQQSPIAPFGWMLTRKVQCTNSTLAGGKAPQVQAVSFIEPPGTGNMCWRATAAERPACPEASGWPTVGNRMLVCWYDSCGIRPRQLVWLPVSHSSPVGGKAGQEQGQGGTGKLVQIARGSGGRDWSLGLNYVAPFGGSFLVASLVV